MNCRYMKIRVSTTVSVSLDSISNFQCPMMPHAPLGQSPRPLRVLFSFGDANANENPFGERQLLHLGKAQDPSGSPVAPLGQSPRPHLTHRTASPQWLPHAPCPNFLSLNSHDSLILKHFCGFFGRKRFVEQKTLYIFTIDRFEKI
ncbi:hypothetical protein NIES4103_61130 [Nostoc sp. NIES-4103]|nr:hypothetical protein NIES4103_61130 [Nostoc sp. NIES-4103]